MIFLISLFVLLFVFVRLNRSVKCVGFFHPYCDAGGGGERVLWEAVKAISASYPEYRIVVFSGDCVASELILQRAADRFNIKLPQNVEIVNLKSRVLVEAATWPIVTLLGQSLGSLILALEAILKLNPEVMIDSMGYSFTYPLFRLVAGCRVGCYIHYPTISTDMLQRVEKREANFNNRGVIAGSPFLSALKLYYYRLFAWSYGICGRFSSAVMTNSSWTAEHIDTLWSMKSAKIFPPCDVSAFQKLKLSEKREAGLIVSLAQFRPEKNHKLQIHAFYKLKDLMPDSNIRLIMAGGVRNEGDTQRADNLEALIAKLGLEDFISLERNVTFDRMLELFESAECGIHTMVDEHFGITCVDFQASGVIPVAHNSAGPKRDIVVPFDSAPTGCLADTDRDFAEQMKFVLNLDASERLAMQKNMRKSCCRFSAHAFSQDFIAATKRLFQ